MTRNNKIIESYTYDFVEWLDESDSTGLPRSADNTVRPDDDRYAVEFSKTKGQL